MLFSVWREPGVLRHRSGRAGRDWKRESAGESSSSGSVSLQSAVEAERRAPTDWGYQVRTGTEHFIQTVEGQADLHGAEWWKGSICSGFHGDDPFCFVWFVSLERKRCNKNVFWLILDLFLADPWHKFGLISNWSKVLSWIRLKLFWRRHKIWQNLSHFYLNLT